MRAADRGFYLRWIGANAWAEAVGLGTTLVLAWRLAPTVDRLDDVLVIIAGALGAVVLGTVLEGVVVGLAQQGVLRSALPLRRRHSWLWATAIGAGIAWLLGMIPSTLASLSRPATSSAPPPEPGVLLQYGLGAALGVALGLVLGLAQWVVLRGIAAGAGRWVAANAAAWAVGMPLVYVGMHVVPWSSGTWAIIPSIVLTCGIVGSTVGAIHGLVLLRILRDTATNGRPPTRLETDPAERHA
jgi:multisubunit Na+/H+ antiporter MnhE subunit